ncbi:MAG: hypothetical protein Q7V88_06875 [Actinomycetota bacterium]|nr:hypothetical protein [Actinomycetota bacterium]
MGFWDTVTDAVDDLGDTITGSLEVVVDTVTDGGSALAGAVASVAEPVSDFASTLTSPIWAFGETVVDTVTDPVGAMQALGDIITDPVGAVEGAFGSVMDHGMGLVSDFGGIVHGVGFAGVGLLRDGIDSGLGVAGAAGDIAVDAIGGAAGLANAGVGGYGDDVLDFLDDNVLDKVDYVTGGVINIDFDDGALTANVGVDDLLGVGFGISGDGVTVSSDAPLLGVDVGITDSHGATVLLDENIPGVDLPAGADVGIGLDADGGLGVIAELEDLRGITVGILGDYDADITLEQVEALAGSTARTAPADGVTTTAGGSSTDLDAEILNAPQVADVAADLGNSLDDTAPVFESSALEPEPQTDLSDFSQDLELVDQQQAAADDVWDDLG